MGILTIPEEVLFNIVTTLLKQIRIELANPNLQEEQTFLYVLLKGKYDGGIDYYQEALRIFGKKPQDERFLTVKQELNKERLNSPSITIISGVDKLHESQSLGYGQGDQEEICFEDRYYEVYSRRYRGDEYQLLVTSTNFTEVMIIEMVIKAGLTSLFQTTESLCLQDVKIGTSAVSIDDEQFGASFRVIELSFFYDMKTPKLFGDAYINEITFDGKIKI